MVESPNPGETANGTAKPVQTETGDKKSPDKKSPGVSQLLLLSLCLAIALAAIHSWCICRPTHDCDSPIDYNQYLSSRSSYEYFRGNELGKEHDEPGCESQQLYMVIRHAVRFPDRAAMRKMSEMLISMQKLILSHADDGNLCPEKLLALKHWTGVKFPRNNITPSGLADMFQMGLRIFNAYPGLFNFESLSQEPNRTLEVQTTKIRNVNQSTHALLEGLLFRAHSEDVFNASRDNILETTKYDDRLIYPTQGCKRFFLNREFNSYSPDNFERVKLIKSDIFESMLQEMENNLGLPTGSIQKSNVSVMNEACIYGLDLYSSDIWCQIMGVDALKMYEYMSDLKYYHRYGYGYELAHGTLCTMIQDFMRTVRDLTSGKSEQRVHIRVGHSGTIVSLLTRLGFLNGDPVLRGDDYTGQTNRKWKLSSINPFSSNVAFVISKCGNDRYLRVYLNEREVELPGCGSPCPLQDMFKIMEPLTENCDYRAYCDVQLPAGPIYTQDSRSV